MYRPENRAPWTGMALPPVRMDAVEHAPFFSVMVPTYNQADYLAECLHSIVVQSDPGWEAVVVDDGSTDDTPRVLSGLAAKDKRIRALRQDNAGTAAALNTALGACRGKWICWLSSDDLFEPDKLAIHREAISRHPDILFFHTHFYDLDQATGEKTAPSHWRPIPEAALQVARFFSGNYVSGITICVERQAMLEAGPFRTDLRYAQDFALWLALSRRHRSFFIENRTAVTRRHPGQETNTFPVAGFYDSAWACLEFLRQHRFEELFPALDLDLPEHCAMAVRETLDITLDHRSFVHQLGYHPGLVMRLLQWACGGGGPGRGRALEMLGQAPLRPGLAGEPAQIRELLHACLTHGDPAGYVPESVPEFIRRTVADPRTTQAKRQNLSRYLAAKVQAGLAS